MSDDNAARRQANANHMGEVILRAWTDEDFKQRLIADPSTVLQESGVEMPSGVGVKVVQDTDEVNYLVLPTKPADMEVSDFQSDDVSWCWSYNALCSF